MNVDHLSMREAIKMYQAHGSLISLRLDRQRLEIQPYLRHDPMMVPVEFQVRSRYAVT